MSYQQFDILRGEAVELNSRLRTNFSQFVVSAVALYIMDYFLILPREVALIWKKRIGFGGMLYLIARFSTGISLFFSCLPYLNESECSFRICYISPGLDDQRATYKVVLEAIFIIRAYAISNQNRHVLVALTSLALGFIIPALMYIASITCDTPIRKAQNMVGVLDADHNGSISAEFILINVILVFFDIVLIVVTLYHTLGLRRLQVGMRFGKVSLTSLLIQQGLVRFIVSLGVAVALIVPNQPRFNNILVYHGLIVQNAIVSRFFLDLRWFSARPNGTTFTKAMAQQSLQSQHWVVGSTSQDAAHSQWSFDSVHNAARRTLDLESQVEGFEGLYRMRRRGVQFEYSAIAIVIVIVMG
ncbi:hypothetical protein K439DRAFT_1612104 [Ramaria rubella]|nr:hypothetical protein K439DRAFT_1612104 [Ramaria rubella]